MSQHSEKNYIKAISPYLETGYEGIGDDCACVLPPQETKTIVVSTDMLIENTHFLNNSETDWRLLGNKAVAANISDIAAMGAHPRYMVISVGIPDSFSEENLRSLYAGIWDLASPLNTKIIGGDTCRSAIMCINITIWGDKDRTAAQCRRSDLMPGDYLYVSGELGKSKVGLHFILNEKSRREFSPEFSEACIKNHFSPVPRVNLGLFLSSQFSRVSMIDISDSLFNELSLLSENSRVQNVVRVDKIPLHNSVKEFAQYYHLNPVNFALFSGEEYELLFGIPCPPEELEQLLSHQNISVPVTCIGRVQKGNGVLFQSAEEKEIIITDETFNHFTS